MTKPWLVKVRALFYVLATKRGCLVLRHPLLDKKIEINLFMIKELFYFAEC